MEAGLSGRAFFLSPDTFLKPVALNLERNNVTPMDESIQHSRSQLFGAKHGSPVFKLEV